MTISASNAAAIRYGLRVGRATCRDGISAYTAMRLADDIYRAGSLVNRAFAHGYYQEAKKGKS